VPQRLVQAFFKCPICGTTCSAAWYFIQKKTKPKPREEDLLKNLTDSSAITKLQAAISAIIILASVTVVAFGFTSLNSNPQPFQISIVNRPASFGEALYSIPNQKCLFLISINETNSDDTPKAVNLSATSPDCQITISPQAITLGQVAELMVIPSENSVGTNITVTIKGERDGRKQTKTLTFEVIAAEEREETLGPTAAQLRDKFTQWLTTTHPELGITNTTTWTGTVVNPMVLVVMHYMFLSEDWEMYLTWHVMIPPYDWAKIYLRHRFNATAPSYAFEISSLQGQTQPIPIEVEDWV
jgi:hypothetical protein